MNKVGFMKDRVVLLLLVCFSVGLAGYVYRLPGNKKTFMARASSSENRYALLEGRKININAASASELKQIPRLSWKVALGIVALRKQKGYIVRLDELLEVKGVGEKTLERLRSYAEVKPKV